MNERKQHLKDNRTFLSRTKDPTHKYKLYNRPPPGVQTIASSSKSSEAWQLWANLHGVASSLHVDALESHHLVHLLPARAYQNPPPSLHIKQNFSASYIAGGYRKYCIFPAPEIAARPFENSEYESRG